MPISGAPRTARRRIAAAVSVGARAAPATPPRAGSSVWSRIVQPPPVPAQRRAGAGGRRRPSGGQRTRRRRFSMPQRGRAGSVLAASVALGLAAAAPSTPSALRRARRSRTSRRRCRQPPTSSPSTKSCGIVGQLEIAESSWRMRGSGRMSTAANGVPAACSAATVRAENPHVGLLGRALHEEDHVVLGDRLGDRVADRVVGLRRSWGPHGVLSLQARAWIAPPTLAGEDVRRPSGAARCG